MRKGRKPIYEAFEHITDIRTQSKHRVGKCEKCGKNGIKAVNWILHRHDEEDDQIYQIGRNTFIEELIEMATDTINTVSSDFLSKNFTKGIPRICQELYKDNLMNAITTALLSIPDAEDNQMAQIIQIQRKSGKKVKVDDSQDKPNRTKEKKEKGLQKVNLSSTFEPYYYISNHQAVKLQSIIQDYSKNGKNLLSIKNEISVVKIEKRQAFFDLLKECIHCKDLIYSQQSQCRACIYCHSRVHTKCQANLQYCLCSGIDLDKLSHKFSTENGYKEAPYVRSIDLLRSKYQGITIFQPKTNISIIEKYQNQMKQVLEKRGISRFTYEALYPNFTNCQPDALCDPFLNLSLKELKQAYRKYKCQKFKAPVKLKIIGENNFGVEALEIIPKNTLICEYACDILPCIFARTLSTDAKGKIMHYSYGKNGRQQLMLVPYLCSNWAPLINSPCRNSPESQNCGSLRVVVEDKIRVLIYASRRIKAGQELLYDYNGQMKEYPSF